MQVYLIGFMGAGKTTYGKAAAKKAKWHFYDLDDLIESQAHTPISTIFTQKGESYFRALESDVLHQTSHLPNQPALIACGGGTPCYHDNMQWMNAQGTTIYLKPPDEILIGRLRQMRANRPMLSQITESDLGAHISQLIQQREIFYLKAHYVLTEVSRIEKDLIQLLLNLSQVSN